jgi:predicted regulator of Ras-like GTPase activity (Roadblock/LC7/MglB family)
MSFMSHLESVVKQVDGAIGCSVMGFDGIAVESHQVDAGGDVELANTWVEYASILNQVRSAAESLKTGEVTEVSVNTEKVVTVMRMISSEYFLVLAMKPEGNYGKGRYVLRLTAPKLKAEL